VFQFKRQVIDDSTRLYHSRTKLTNKRIEAASKGTPPIEDEEIMTGVGMTIGIAGTIIDPNAPVENPLLEAALEIEGVESAAVTAYTLLIKRAQQFSWDEIEVKVLRLFAAFNMELKGSKIEDK
jgi:hypothetical protein